MPSSLGREMQRIERDDSESRHRGFQCPLRWAGRCNHLRVTIRAVDAAVSVPSSLGREMQQNETDRQNETDQTVSVPSSLGREMQPAFPRLSAQEFLFQCPLRWAGRCNAPSPSHHCRIHRVSVPSSLGREMQRASVNATAIARIGFSALFVGQGDATLPPCPGRSTRPSFSALFVGQGDATDRTSLNSSPRNPGFSALFVGQGDATQTQGTQHMITQAVSVPSSLGREMQQRNAGESRPKETDGFSALFVGQGDATILPAPSAPAALEVFQCPLRWAGRCNGRVRRRATGAQLSFQCPLRWAGRCNSAGAASLVLLNGFQCPLRWAGRCNSLTSPAWAAGTRVSVPSSLGREMQQKSKSGRSGLNLRFSALFVGQGDATSITLNW